MLLEITIPPQEQGEIEIEVKTIITTRVVSTYQLIDEDGREQAVWNLDPRFLTCFNFTEDFIKVALWRINGDNFRLEVDYEASDTNTKGGNIPGSEYVHGESLEVLTVREVQSFSSVKGENMINVLQ